ncbi:MAG: hypothetical protein A49_20970 [Methyloceanibacter sp.]|nr:MAG: hypothetical protein A49_20970 [Methyloceanibacter sp.]
MRYVTAPDGAHHLVVRGLHRFKVLEFLDGYPFLAARIEEIGETEVYTTELAARVHQLRERAREALSLLPNAPQELAGAMEQVESPSMLADFIANVMDTSPANKQDLLETFDVSARIDKVLRELAEQIEVLRLSKQIGEQTQESLSGRQREHILREQLRQIQKELGEGEDGETEIAELGEAIDKAGMSKEAETQAKKELRRLERMPEASAEHGMIRTYLDWLIELPWSKLSEETIDIAEARRILDEDHYGLSKVKQRILEYLAVRKLNPDGKSPILCFVGPPGVGKTSLGQSIARAMGRKFGRISLGGVHDEAEIRGHRRTYVGALPGNIVQALRKAVTRNPVLMLDEMDKLSASFHGDPSAALLEVLDPAQNGTFRDNYLGVPFDLSKVMFIGTANVLDQIPAPLRDRMEVIEIPGYTEEEKVEIAKRYLVQRQLEATGLTPEQCDITEDALRTIIDGYTREAGVRNLEREIGAVCHRVAMRIAEGEAERMRVDTDDLHGILGARKFDNEVAMRTAVPRRRDRPRLDPDRRRHSVHRMRQGPRTRQAHLDRSARRRDEGKRASGSVACESARGPSRHRAERLRKVGHSSACPGRGDPQGRTQRRRGHVHCPHLAAHRPHGPQRPRHDRRNLAARLGAADRRREEQGPGGGPGRNHDRDAARAQPEGL